MRQAKSVKNCIMHAATRPVSSERGDTLLEVLMTVLVVGITSVALLVGFSTSISGSAAHRALATNDVAMRTVSQAVYAQVEGPSGPNMYDPCTTQYGSPTPSSEFNAPTGYLVSVEVTAYWYSNGWQGSPPSGCPSSPPAKAVPQQVLVTLSTPNNRTLTTTIVVNQPLALVTTFAVSSLTPSAAAPGNSGLNITISGSGFAAGVTGSFPADSGITFSGTTGSTSPPSPSPSWTVVSPTSIVAQIDVASTAPVSPETLTLTNPDGTTATSTFTITLGPTITGVSPSQMLPGDSSQTFTITGANFDPTSGSSSTVAFSDPTVFKFVSTPEWTVNSSTTITATISVSSTATPGSYSVAVTNPSSQLTSAPYPVTINYPPPVISTVTGGGVGPPCLISSNSTVTCTVTGKYFDGSVTANVSQSSGNYNACTPVPTLSGVTPNSLTLTFTPSNYQPANCAISGTYDLTIFAAGGQGSFVQAFSSS